MMARAAVAACLVWGGVACGGPAPQATPAPTPPTRLHVFKETSKLTALHSSGLGAAIALSGDVTVVGSGTWADSAYVFYRDEGGAHDWFQVAQLTPSDITAPDDASCHYFGTSVAVSGSTALVGAPNGGCENSGIGNGSAYFFYRDQGGADNWGQAVRLNVSDAAEQDRFGHSVSLSGDIALVGAPRAGPGAAHVFYRNQGGPDNWGQVAQLASPDDRRCFEGAWSQTDYFGWSVAVSGDIALVGAPSDQDSCWPYGFAYVFYRDQGGEDNWGQVAQLTCGDPGYHTLFGWSVAVSGDVALVGARASSLSPGSVYVFQRNEGGDDNWGQVALLIAPDGKQGNLFGTSVAVSGDSALVGASELSWNRESGGSVYVYDRNRGPDNWGLMAKLLASDAAKDDGLGSSVAVSGDMVVVGAKGDDDLGSSAGAVYVFELSPVPIEPPGPHPTPH